MASASITFEETRRHLCRAIAEALDSWPAADRRVFIHSHYGGDSPEKISRVCGMPIDEVTRILHECDARLRDAVRSFKAGDRPPLRLAYSRPVSGVTRT
jgi:DNA-directed RNA polymerase specialized sigma24 family protein